MCIRDSRKLLQVLAPFKDHEHGTILVVDDHPDVRDMMARTLRMAGWTAHTADGGAAALQHLEHHRPDVILLDLMMPDIDGFAVVERIKSHPVWCNIPVIVVTAKDLNPSDRARLRGGVQSVVQKSGRTLEHVVESIESLLGGPDRT